MLSPRYPAENSILALRGHIPEHQAGYTQQEGCLEEELPMKETEVGEEERPPPAAPILPGREAALCGREPGGGELSLAAAQSRTPQKGPGRQAAQTHAHVLVVLKSVV